MTTASSTNGELDVMGKGSGARGGRQTTGEHSGGTSVNSGGVGTVMRMVTVTGTAAVMTRRRGKVATPALRA